MPFDCQHCGACCATYRVSFYWAEAEVLGLPPELVQPLTPVLACLTGTNEVPPRCTALDGRIGAAVACSVYDRRPSPCHELQPGDDKCRRARARHGLVT
jgi:Fe-S-cluster containining protein